MRKRYIVYLIILSLFLLVKFLLSHYTGQKFTWWTTMGIGIGGILGYEFVNSYLNK